MTDESLHREQISYREWWVQFLTCWICDSCAVQLSCSVMTDSLRPHGLQHSRLPCPSPTPRACSESCPLSRWCHPTISSSVIPFSSCLQSLSLVLLLSITIPKCDQNLLPKSRSDRIIHLLKNYPSRKKSRLLYGPLWSNDIQFFSLTSYCTLFSM